MLYGGRKYTGLYARKPGATRTNVLVTPNTLNNIVKKAVNGTVYKPKFATVSYSRNIEKKYYDKTLMGLSTEAQAGPVTSTNFHNRGVMYISTTWNKYGFGAINNFGGTSNDLLKGLGTGTDARTRIGNKIKGVFVKGSLTFNAATVAAAATSTQGGEAVAAISSIAAQDYLRTTIRWCIVRDKQVNSSNQQVGWSDVFDTGLEAAGIHSEPNVDQMGRYVILKDETFVLSAENPQQTKTIYLGPEKLGVIEYNGPSNIALTSRGVYIIWAAFTLGAPVGDLNNIEPPQVVGNSRLCFTDV